MIIDTEKMKQKIQRLQAVLLDESGEALSIERLNLIESLCLRYYKAIDVLIELEERPV